MPSPRNESDLPVLGGRAMPEPTPFIGVLAFLLPSITWLLSLAASYVVEDFTCTAAASAAAPPPRDALLAILIAANVLLLLLTLAAGGVGLRLLRRHPDDEARITSFLGWSIIAFSLVYAYSILLIGVHPLLLEVCG